MAAHGRFFTKLLHTWPHGRVFSFKKAAISLKSGYGRMAGLGTDQIRNFPTEPNLIRTRRQGSVNRTEPKLTEPNLARACLKFEN